jgi:hypothetical protein
MSLETMTKLATYTVAAGGTITEVVFDNIPQGYTDLKILVSARDGTTSGIGSALLGIKLNNDASATQGSHLILYGTGSSMASAKYTNVQFVWASFLTNTSNTSSTFSNVEINISNYSDNQIKVWSADGTTENDATAAYSSFVSGAWNNSSPITMLTVYDYGGSYYFAQHSTFTLYGIKDAIKTAGNSIKATGGNIVFDGTYVYHVFPATGTFTPTQTLTADYLIVAGGGGGGGSYGASINSYSGGGGAGGLYSSASPTGGGGTPGSLLSLVPTSYVVTVGAGGAGGSGNASDGTNGSTSSFSTVTASGGGGGGGGTGTNLNDQGRAGVAGGSGGGASSSYLQNSPSGGAGTTNQGYAGGAGDNNQKSGGGGGAGAVGVSGSAGSTSNGGIGVISPLNPTGAYLAGGGGGARSVSFGVGGSGGGGSAGRNVNGTAGTANTGGGGGGSNDETGSTSRSGGAGGSGIVIIRYKG